jgi:hypothetical protein
MSSASGVNLSFLNGTIPMAILADALPTSTKTYLLALTAPQAGTYTISFEGLASLSNPQWSIYLLDNQTGINTLVTDAASYACSALQGANNGRFSLVVNPAGVTSLSAAISNKVQLSPNPASNNRYQPNHYFPYQQYGRPSGNDCHHAHQQHRAEPRPQQPCQRGLYGAGNWVWGDQVGEGVTADTQTQSRNYGH